MPKKKGKIGLVLLEKKEEHNELSHGTRRLLQEMEKAGCEGEIFYYDLFAVFLEKNKIEIYYQNKKINPRDFLYFHIQYYFYNSEFMANSFIAQALALAGVRVSNPPQATLIAKNKRETLALLAAKGIAVIPTGINFSQFFLDQQLKRAGKGKIIAKTNNGAMGYGVSVFDSQISFISFMELMGNNYQPANILIQPFIDCGAEDYRVFVVGGQAVAAMKRKARGIEFRANVSKGGEGTAIKADKKMNALAVKAVKIIGLDYAGVDILKDGRGRLLMAEINPNPGLKIEEATGVNVVERIVRYCLGKK